MRKKIIGATVGTPISPSKIENEIKPIKTVNGKTPDENGNVNVVSTGADTEQVETNKQGISQLWDMINTLTLGIHLDELLYIFVDGKPVGNGVPWTATDFIYKNNKIVITDLVAGTYSLRYEDDNGLLEEYDLLTSLEVG